jgi:hypothetical protein
MGNNTKTIKGTKIRVMINERIGIDISLNESPKMNCKVVIDGKMAIQTMIANFHFGTGFIKSKIKV